MMCPRGARSQVARQNHSVACSHPIHASILPRNGARYVAPQDRRPCETTSLLERAECVTPVQRWRRPETHYWPTTMRTVQYRTAPPCRTRETLVLFRRSSRDDSCSVSQSDYGLSSRMFLHVRQHGRETEDASPTAVRPFCRPDRTSLTTHNESCFPHQDCS